MRKHQHSIATAFLWLLVILLLLFNGYVFFVRRGVGPGYYFHKIFAEPKDNITDSTIYKDLSEEYHYFNCEQNSKLVAVFAGDSITKRFNIHEFANNHDILNRGIPNDTTYGLLKRMDNNIVNLRVDKLFIMIGYNDLEYRNNGEIVDNIAAILSKSKTKETYVQSLLPVCSQRKEANNRIVLINDKLKKLAEDSGYFYVDLHSQFKGNANGIAAELTRDGTHPNYLGYQLWYSIIEPLL